ncbi:hypothetical protein [Shinella zoogloeoides]|uniref:hypothetical protein n=1 Tax=Shinella zoogloeoides TaxID=352475 RepID=UPI00273D7269|nr:hypothetical protein [Shinella zoogloeoides]WLR90933.1 hypothetical protein Q9316_00720 [Shinella zoogloeoides]
MIVEHLVNAALMSGRLVITEPTPGHFHLKVRFGGAYVTLSRVAVLTEEHADVPVVPHAPEPESVEVKIEVPEVVVAPSTSAQILAFPGAGK